MSKKRVNKYPNAFRQMALERMRSCENVSALAQELGVDRTVLYHWRNRMQPDDGTGSTANSPVRELRKQVRDLKRVLAEKALEGDFFGASVRFRSQISSVDCLNGGVHPIALWAKLRLRNHPESIKFNMFQQALAKAFNSNHFQTTKFNKFQ